MPAITAFSAPVLAASSGHHEATEHAREKAQQQGSSSDSQASPTRGTDARITMT
jgi:hypothetical protein